MENETMSSVLASVSTRKEKAAKAMAALHSHRNLITACIADWENLERSFGITERALQQQFKELSERESEFDSKMEEARAVFRKREESIAGREETSLARVKEQKDTAMVAIAEERSKFEEERSKWRAEKGISDKEADAQSNDAGQDKMHNTDAAIKVQKEKGAQKQDLSTIKPSKDTKNVQQKKGSSAGSSSKSVHNDAARKDALSKETKDAQQKKGSSAGSASKNAFNGESSKDTPSVAASGRKNIKEAGIPGPQKMILEIKEATQKHENPQQSFTNKRKDGAIDDEVAAKRRKEASELNAKDGADLRKGTVVKNTPSLEEAINLAAEPSVPTQIKDFVEKLDYEGLKEFFINNRKDLQKLRPDLQAALQACGDPCRLSLKILELSEGVDKVSASNKCGHSCILLLECLSDVVADPVLGLDFPVIPAGVKDMARSVARRWKSLLEKHPQDNLALSSHLFLQLLATFGIGTDYTAEELLNHVVSMSRRGVGPSLCRTLGLTERIPVVVDRLIREGKQIDALGYASTFGLLDRFNPRALFRSYLEDSQKKFDADKIASEGGQVGELYTKQIAAVKNAIKVLEDHKLDSQLPMEDLRNRVSALKQGRAAFKKGSNSKVENQHEKLFNETEPGRPNGNRINEAGTRPGFDSTHEIYGGRVSSLERGNYVPTDLGRLGRVDYTPTDIGKPLFPPYGLDRPNRLNDSTYDGYGRSPVSLSNSNPYAQRDGIGSYSRGAASSAGIHSYGGMPRDEAERLLSASRGGRLPYPESHAPSSSYSLGSGLPASSNYLPYYLR